MSDKFTAADLRDFYALLADNPDAAVQKKVTDFWCAPGLLGYPIPGEIKAYWRIVRQPREWWLNVYENGRGYAYGSERKAASMTSGKCVARRTIHVREVGEEVVLWPKEGE